MPAPFLSPLAFDESLSNCGASAVQTPILLPSSNEYATAAEIVVICPQCQHVNPDINRFCGNCGTALQGKARTTASVTTATCGTKTSTSAMAGSSESHYEREGYDEEDAPKLSPEVVEYDKTVPLIAEPGSDRRRKVPQHIVDEVHEFLEEFHRTGAPPAAREESAAYEAQLRAEKDARTNARADAAVNTPPPEARRSNYLDLDEPNRRDRVAGPSFLGLGNSDYEYVYDDQPPSHWRRNFAFIVLIVLAVLAAVQWRSIRNMGLEYAKNGSIKVGVPRRGQPAQPNANANANAPTNTASDGNHPPIMSVAPTRNTDAENKLRSEGDAAHGQPVQQPNNAQQNNSTATNPQPGSANGQNAAAPANTATTDDVANTHPAANASPSSAPANDISATNAKPTQQAANNAPTAMGSPAASPKNTVTAEEASPPPTHTAAEPARRQHTARMSKANAIPNRTASPSVPGAFEMQQADTLGQTPSAVPWLWSALGKGNPDAPVKLADMYLTGRGVEKSCDQGLVILRSAATRGNARASARLGTLYATGICVPQNRVQAYEWMGTAAGRSSSLSTWAEQYRRSLWQQMTPEERGRVQ
ncbi:MAG TPA: zinc-ribbon domain-containing protein [Candidatus Acidoferrales bacterium]|nr:zinc-ribbon domain-containing protein [Candidatus Acidoferrales bacterium]